MFLVLLVAPARSHRAHTPHKCIHDRLPRPPKRTIPVRYNEHGSGPSREQRRLSLRNTVPIRIRWRLIDSAALADKPSVRSLIEEKMLGEAVAFWQEALSVVPVSGALYFTEACTLLRAIALHTQRTDRCKREACSERAACHARAMQHREHWRVTRTAATARRLPPPPRIGPMRRCHG